VPYRGSHRRRSKVTLVAPPIVMAAAASISVSASAVQPAHPAAAVADVSELGPAVPLEPFAAMPAVVPFPSRTVTITRHSPPASAPIAHLPTDLSGAAAAIPRRALAAYVNAARIVDTMQPECELSWQTLAGIGLIESDHARSGGSASPHWNGVATPPIYGPPLDGSGKDARIPNSDPAVDGAGRWARAVGPMQFIPSTWSTWAADGNGDGVKNPQDIDDATLAAANYLCAASQHLKQPANLIRAVYAYNHSYTYVKAVLVAAAHYGNIDPAKLGINGLPGAAEHRKAGKHRKAASLAAAGVHNPAATHSPTPAPAHSPVGPSQSPTPTPTPIANSGSPTPSTSPTASPTDSVPPTGSAEFPPPNG
jgi:membrane-bound lytic murein transglycosylase B